MDEETFYPESPEFRAASLMIVAQRLRSKDEAERRAAIEMIRPFIEWVDRKLGNE